MERASQLAAGYGNAKKKSALEDLALVIGLGAFPRQTFIFLPSFDVVDFVVRFRTSSIVIQTFAISQPESHKVQ